MRVFTVHEAPAAAVEPADALARFGFVREGSYAWAFIFGPIWMLRHRLWLPLLGYALVIAALVLLRRFAPLDGSAFATALFIIHLLIGLEASTLLRFGLDRRGWDFAAVVTGADLEAAERRFYDDALAAAEQSAPSRQAPESTGGAGSFLRDHHVGALFPAARAGA